MLTAAHRPKFNASVGPPMFGATHSHEEMEAKMDALAECHKQVREEAEAHMRELARTNPERAVEEKAAEPHFPSLPVPQIQTAPLFATNSDVSPGTSVEKDSEDEASIAITGMQAAAEAEEHDEPQQIVQHIQSHVLQQAHASRAPKRQKVALFKPADEVDVETLTDVELVTLWRELRGALKHAETALQRQGGRVGLFLRRTLQRKLEDCQRRYNSVHMKMQARNFGHGLDEFNADKWPEVWATN